MKKIFEYQCSELDVTVVEGGRYYVQEWLNNQGAEGWEVIAIKKHYPHYEFFLKREICQN